MTNLSQSRNLNLQCETFFNAAIEIARFHLAKKYRACNEFSGSLGRAPAAVDEWLAFRGCHY